jgi:hypothetical protein
VRKVLVPRRSIQPSLGVQPPHELHVLLRNTRSPCF